MLELGEHGRGSVCRFFDDYDGAVAKGGVDAGGHKGWAVLLVGGLVAALAPGVRTGCAIAAVGRRKGGLVGAVRGHAVHSALKRGRGGARGRLEGGLGECGRGEKGCELVFICW